MACTPADAAGAAVTPISVAIAQVAAAVTAAATATDAAIVATAAVAAIAQGIDSATNKLQKSLQRLLVIARILNIIV